MSSEKYRAILNTKKECRWQKLIKEILIKMIKTALVAVIPVLTIIFLHLYKAGKRWKRYLVRRIMEIEDSRHSEVEKMIDSLAEYWMPKSKNLESYLEKKT